MYTIFVICDIFNLYMGMFAGVNSHIIFSIYLIDSNYIAHSLLLGIKSAS